MERRYPKVALAAIVATIAMFGCNGGDGVAPIAPQRPFLRPESRGPGSNLIWVENNNYKFSSLTGYQVTDNGDPQPTQIITGSATQLVNPEGLFKTAGTLFVTQYPYDNYFTANILMFAVSSNGNVAPTAVIAGSNTALADPGQIAVTTTGAIIVPDDGRVLTFAPGKFGNVSPIRVISGSNTLLNGNVNNGIATHNGLIYVVSATPYPQYVPEILVFHETDNGNVAPIRVITGPNTGLNGPEGIKVDKAGDLYVANYYGGNPLNSSITEYAPVANGDASPIATLQGPHTLLDESRDLVLNDQSSRMFVVGDGLGVPLLTGYSLPLTGDETPFMNIQGGLTLMAYPTSVAH